MKNNSYTNNNANQGFTLIELMIAVIIFAALSIISYRTLSSLITTKNVVTNSQKKWGSIAKTVNLFSTAWNRSIPLIIRDSDGTALPAVWGKQELHGKFDSQLEITEAGFIGDNVYGSSPPKRVGFRFVGDKLYLVTWPVLNRIQNTTPEIDLLLANIDQFKISYFYPDRQWRDTWPASPKDITTLPNGLKLYIKMKTGEEINRQWSL